MGEKKAKPFGWLRRLYKGRSIQFILSILFTLAAVGCILLMGVLMFMQFAANLRSTILQDNQQLLNQASLNMTVYTRNMMSISDSMYYSVIKDTDLATESLEEEMALLYSVNVDYLLSIACFTETGELIAATPLSGLKPGVDPTRQEWFTSATSVIENQHFSGPHVQNLFDDTSYKYNWAISLSRMVELNTGGTTQRGVLLVDMKYSGVEQIFTQMTGSGAGYVYLVDKNGEIIYHPRQKLIYSGLYNENNAAVPNYADGIHEESFEGAGRQVIVKTLSYTGWRLVSVIPNSAFNVTTDQMRILAIAIVAFAILLIVAVNSFVSAWVADPIKRLERSVKGIEKGELSGEIYVGGPEEIEHLGRTIRSMVGSMRRLMDDVVYEQEEKRKHEFDALQTQINPHFLYNTLDSIVWMVESERYAEAISMVTALANLFRISLSRGSDIIPIRTELQHARHYLHIQNIRYKNKFTVKFEIDPAIEDCTTIKLIVQPLLENAIYHAMEYKDGDGLITIRGSLQGQNIFIDIVDNGLGMPPEALAQLLRESPPAQPGGKRGSGIGLRNVHQRIRLFYGEQYGLEVSSELDVGTTVRIHLPRMEPGATAEGGKNT